MAQVLFERDGHAGFITLAAPERHNRLDVPMMEEVLAAFDRAARDDEVRVVVVTGAGEKAFCAGADIAMFRDTDEPLGIPAGLRDRWLAITGLPKPLIAAINGYALGGGSELLLMSDVAIAAAEAQVGFPEITLGIFPGAGGSQLLPRIVGPRVAKELILSGRWLNAAEALELRLVNYVVPRANFREFVARYARTMAERSPIALQAAKRAIDFGQHLPLAAAFAVEAEQVRRVFAGSDRVEGMQAFLEKRSPRFS